MDQKKDLAAAFEAQRRQLRSVAYRMLGTLSEADDAVQGAWLHLERSGTEGVENLPGWLTTVVARLCLDLLRARKARQEQPMDPYLPEPVVVAEEGSNPEQDVIMADSISLALLVVLETLAPAERLAFVLHDMFGVPFEEIAGMVGRTPSAARQLASRGRRRVQGAAVVHDADVDVARQREVVNAFLAASRGGDLQALLAVLDPEVVLRADRGREKEVRGARTVAEQSLYFNRLVGGQLTVRPVLVNGTAGLITLMNGKPYAVMGFTIVGGKIVEIYIVTESARLGGMDRR